MKLIETDKFKLKILVSNICPKDIIYIVDPETAQKIIDDETKIEKQMCDMAKNLETELKKNE